MVMTWSCRAGSDSRIDAWGDPGPTAHLMHSIKRQYDPQRLLNPGRFVAGI
jgi:FAD/FMN-containing dehydrogenase